MSQKPKSRASLDDILASCSERLFPDKMGKAPVTLNSRDANGDTPLHVMLWRKDTYAVELIIQAGAEVNAVGDMSETPLHIAVRKQNIKAIEALLKAGADVTRVSEFGQSPRDIALDIGGGIRRLFVGS
jgi:ankyrin repeat protein